MWRNMATNNKMDFQAPSTDMSWLVKLSDSEYAKFKARYADFMHFAFFQVTKELAKFQIITDEDLAEEFANEVIEEVIKDGSFGPKLTKRLKEEIAKEKKG